MVTANEIYEYEMWQNGEYKETIIADRNFAQTYAEDNGYTTKIRACKDIRFLQDQIYELQHSVAELTEIITELKELI